MTVLKECLLRYEPWDETEAADRALMLRAMEAFPDCLSRENPVCHFTASNWITNPARNKILLVHHNIYNRWAWTGGHADGESDLQKVALREAMEETGLKRLISLWDGIFSLQCLCVERHWKNGSYVASHLHLDCCFLWQAAEDEALRCKPDENSGVRWVPMGDVIRTADEPAMDFIYTKLNRKLTALPPGIQG